MALQRASICPTSGMVDCNVLHTFLDFRTKVWAAPTSETLEKLLGKEAAARFKAVPDRFAELAICVRSSFPWLEKLAQLDTSVLFDLHGVLVGQPPELLTMLQADEVSLLCDFEETRNLL